MVQMFVQQPQQPNPLGQALGQGLGQFAQRMGQQEQQQQQQSGLADALFGEDAGKYKDQTVQSQIQIAKMQQTERMQIEKNRRDAQFKPITIKDMTASWINRGFNKESFGIIPSDDWWEILDRANQLQSTLGPDKAIIQAQDEYLDPKGQQKKQEKQQQQKDEVTASNQLEDIENFNELQDDKGEEGSIARGLRSSISGRLTAILNDVPYDQYQSSIDLCDDPSFMDRLKYQAAKMTGDSPYIGAGATVGAATGAEIGSVGGPYGTGVGMAVGGGFGAFALPSMLDTALDEFHKFKTNGYEGSFEDFLNVAGKTLNVGIESGAEGAMFGILSKALPMLKSMSPAFESFLEKSKVPQSVATGTIEATGLLTAKSASKGELPSKEEIADTLAQVIGLNVINALPEKVYNKIEKTGQPVEKVVEAVEREINDKGYDRENPKQVERAITDVTESYKGRSKEISKDIFETIKKFKGPETAEEAKSLAERDIEKTIKTQEAIEKKKARGPTEKEQAKRDEAGERKKKVESQIESNKEDIKSLNEALANKKTNPRDRKTYENVIKIKESESVTLEKERNRLEGVEKKGIETFSKESLKEPISKHLTELKKAASDPAGTTHQVWKEMFKRDQKHIDEFNALANKGKLPEAKYKDRYIKTLEAYKEAYSNLSETLEDNIIEHQKSIEGLNKNTNKSKQAGKEIDNMKRELDLLRKNIKINEAKTGKHVDKINQMYSLNKPGSPITKQILKGLRREVPQLQKDFIKQKKKLDAIDKRSQSVFKNSAERLEKSLKAYEKNPSDVNLKKLIEESGVTPKEVKTAKETGKKLSETLIEKVKEKSSKAEVMKAIESVLNKIPGLVSSQAKQALVAIGITEAREKIEQLTGLKIPFTGISIALASVTDIKRGTLFYVYSSIYKQLKESYSDWSEKSKYQNLKTPQEKIKHIKNLRTEGYTPAQLKKIMKS